MKALQAAAWLLMWASERVCVTLHNEPPEYTSSSWSEMIVYISESLKYMYFCYTHIYCFASEDTDSSTEVV